MRQQQQRTSTCTRLRSSTTRRTTLCGDCWKQSTDHAAVQKLGRNTWQKSFNRSDFTAAQRNPTSTWQQVTCNCFVLVYVYDLLYLEEEQTVNTLFKAIQQQFFYDQHVRFQQETQWQWHFLAGTLPTEETTTRSACQMTISQHSWQKQTCRIASQHQHQARQHWTQQQQTMTNHFQQRNMLSTDEQSGNFNGWHAQAPSQVHSKRNKALQADASRDPQQDFLSHCMEQQSAMEAEHRQQLHSLVRRLNCMPSTLAQQKHTTRSASRSTQTHPSGKSMATRIGYSI